MLSPVLSRSFRRASHSSSVRSRRPSLSTAEAVFFCLLGLLLVPELAPAILAQVTSLPTVRALDRPAIGRLLFFITIFPAILFFFCCSLMLLASPVIQNHRRIRRPYSGSPRPPSAAARCWIHALTRCTPTRRDLIPSQADCAVRLVERDASISRGTDRNMAANANRSSRYSIVSPSSDSTACHNPSPVG